MQGRTLKNEYFAVELPLPHRAQRPLCGLHTDMERGGSPAGLRHHLPGLQADAGPSLLPLVLPSIFPSRLCPYFDLCGGLTPAGRKQTPSQPEPAQPFFDGDCSKRPPAF